MRDIVILFVVLSCVALAINVNETTMLSEDHDFNGSGFNITVSDIVLDCGGHSITGNGTGYGIFWTGVTNVSILNCVISDFWNGVWINSTEALIKENTIYNCTDYGLYLRQSNSSIIYNNNIYNNSGGTLNLRGSIYSDQKIELSHHFMGNYWGTTSCPAFRASNDSNRIDVLDSFAYTSKYTTWPTISSCTPSVTINSVMTNYSRAYDVAGEGDIVEFIINTSINDSIKDEAYINMTGFNCSVVNLTYDGLWHANCTIVAGLEGIYNADVYTSSIYNDSDIQIASVTIDSINPIVILTGPTNDSYINATNQTSFSFTVSDNSNLSSCTYFLNDTAVLTYYPNVSGNYSQALFSSLAYGEYNWHVGCTDIAGNAVNSSKWYFRDGGIAAPILTINHVNITYPVNQTVLGMGDTVTISVNASGINDSNLRYAYINATSINCSTIQLIYASGIWQGSCNVSQRNTEGEVIIGIYLENIYRQNATDVSSLVVDTKAPLVDLLEPANGSYWVNITESTEFRVNVTDDVSTEVDCSIYWDGSFVKNDSFSTGIVVFSNITSGLAEGLHSWHIVCIDSFDNTNVSMANIFSVDQTFPTLTNFAALNGTTISRDSNIIVNFSETTMDPETFTSSSVVLRASNTAATSLNITQGILTIDPYLMLESNTSYTLTLKTAIKDLVGNALNESIVIDLSVYILDAPIDNVSRITGNLSFVNTNLDLDIAINGSSNLTLKHTGNLEVNITAGADKVMDFNYSFSSTNFLDLTELTIVTDEYNSLGSIVIHGIMTNGNKTVYLDKIADYNGVCIKDSTVVSATEISDDCSGSNEYFVACNGTNGQYTCTDLGTRLKVTNLVHSGVKQMNDTEPPVRVSSGISRDDRDITLRITTDEPSKCRFGFTYSRTYSQMGETSPKTDEFSTNHSWIEEDLDDDDYEYFIKCIDSVGNEMPNAWNITFTVNEDGGDDTSSSSGGSSSGGGGSSSGGASSNIEARKSKTWNQIAANQKITWNLDESKIPVRTLSFSVSVMNDANPSMEIRSLKEKPSLVKTLTGSVYQYMEFYSSNLYAIQNAKISFRVSDKWVKDEVLDPEKIKLSRYYQKKWTTLTTTYKGKSGSYHNYEATTPGFSYFAISGSEKVSGSSSSSDDTSVADEPQIPEATALAASSVSTVQQDANLTERAVTKKPHFSLKYLKSKTKVMNGIALMLLIVAGGLFAFRRAYIKRKPHLK